MRLYGKNSVIERLRQNPQTIRKITIEQKMEGLGDLYKRAKKHGIGILNVEPFKMKKLSRNKNTQGVIADITEYEYADYADVLERGLQKKWTLVFLDNVTDPQNLGAMVRSLACLGRFAIVLPSHDSVSVTENVLRVASGGDNYVPITIVNNLNKALKKAKDKGYWIVGATVDGGTNMDEFDWPHPIGLVMGSEDKGIRPVVEKNLDFKLSIPMQHDTMSFNVAHATTVICHEIAKNIRNYNKK